MDDGKKYWYDAPEFEDEAYPHDASEFNAFLTDQQYKSDGLTWEEMVGYYRSDFGTAPDKEVAEEMLTKAGWQKQPEGHWHAPSDWEWYDWEYREYYHQLEEGEVQCR